MKVMYVVGLICIAVQMDAYYQFDSPQAMLKLAAVYLPQNPVILEAGAYDGTDSINMATCWSNCTVHSFEPVPELYLRLKHKTRNYSNIHTYELALSTKVGKAEFFISELASNLGVPSGSSSLLEPKYHVVLDPSILFKKKISVSTTTIDQWAQEHAVDHIDFLWLDMQGSELNALMAAPKIMKTVKAIITEVEFVEAYKGQYQYQDVKKWLESQGFCMIGADCNLNNPPWFADALFVRTNKQ